MHRVSTVRISIPPMHFFCNFRETQEVFYYSKVETIYPNYSCFIQHNLFAFRIYYATAKRRGIMQTYGHRSIINSTLHFNYHSTHSTSTYSSVVYYLLSLSHTLAWLFCAHAYSKLALLHTLLWVSAIALTLSQYSIVAVLLLLPHCMSFVQTERQTVSHSIAHKLHAIHLTSLTLHRQYTKTRVLECLGKKENMLNPF